MSEIYANLILFGVLWFGISGGLAVFVWRQLG